MRIINEHTELQELVRAVLVATTATKRGLKLGPNQVDPSALGRKAQAEIARRNIGEHELKTLRQDATLQKQAEQDLAHAAMFGGDVDAVVNLTLNL